MQVALLQLARASFKTSDDLARILSIDRPGASACQLTLDGMKVIYDLAKIGHAWLSSDVKPSDLLGKR